MAATQAETPSAAAAPRTVNHPSLKDTAAAYLREQILTGTLRPAPRSIRTRSARRSG